MNETIQRYVPLEDFEIKRARQGRTVTAYATFFDQESEIQDQHGHYIERINPRAFARTLSHIGGDFRRVHVFYNHGYDLSGKPNLLGAVPIATPVDIKADGRGLLTISRYNDSPMAEGILAAWEDGQITGQSFRGRVFSSRKSNGAGLPLIERTELGLREYGPTHSPAYDGDGLVAIRSRAALEEMVRSMIVTMTGTPPTAPPVESATSDLEPGEDHADSRRDLERRRQRLALRRRAQELGVVHGTQAQE